MDNAKRIREKRIDKKNIGDKALKFIYSDEDMAESFEMWMAVKGKEYPEDDGDRRYIG